MSAAGGQGAEGEPLQALFGARVRRVDLPAPDLVAISLAKGELRTVLLLSASARAPGVGCVPERPKGEPAAGFATFLRTHVAGAALAGAERRGSALLMHFAREASEVLLVLEPGPNVVCVREGRILGALSVPRLRERNLGPGAPWSPPEEGRPMHAGSRLEELLAAGAALASLREGKAEDEGRTAFLRAARAEKARVLRRLAAIEKDRARADDSPRWRAEASAILAHAGELAASRKERALELDGVPVVIPAGAAPVEHAGGLFERAKKLEAGVRIAEGRAAEARRELERLDAAIAAAEEDDADYEALARLLRLRVRPAGPAARAQRPEERTPYRTFFGHADRPILVGKGARDNDALTTKVARPHDLWLHVRGAHGSHVVVPLARGESCPAELLVDAAHLAVRHSELEGTTDADVTYVERRYVKKPRGSAPGAVTFERDKTLALRVEPERLARLLARQEK